MNPIVEKAPQLRSRDSTFKQMMEFFLCLLVLYACAVLFYFLEGGGNGNYPASAYGLYALQNGLMAILFSDLADVLWNLPLLFRKEKTVSERLKEYGYQILHSYSYVSGLLLALLLPIGPEWWEIAITAFLSTFMMKLFFGGFGSNIFNPAIFGRVFAQIVFGKHLTTYLGSNPGTLDIATGASVPALAKGDLFGSTLMDYPLWKLFIGDYYGALGETFTIVILLIAFYLCFRKIIDWRVPVIFIGTLYLAFLVLFLSLGAKAKSFEYAFRYLLIGGIFFGGVFCLTDPVTSPTSRAGRVLFALSAALLTLVIRLYASAPEGVAYSILCANALTPLIDKILKGRTRKTKGPAFIAILLFLSVISVALSYGFTHPVSL
jgi:electron transport complex protein RnfD